MTSSVRRQVPWSVFLPRGARVRAAFSPGPTALCLQPGSQCWAEGVRVAWPAQLPAGPPAPTLQGTHTNQCSPRSISSCPASRACASRRAW